MKGLLKGPARWMAPVLLAAGLVLAPPTAPTARAQEEVPGEAKAKKGDPVPGYLGLGLLSMLAIFIVGKSARR